MRFFGLLRLLIKPQHLRKCLWIYHSFFFPFCGRKMLTILNRKILAILECQYESKEQQTRRRLSEKEKLEGRQGSFQQTPRGQRSNPQHKACVRLLVLSSYQQIATFSFLLQERHRLRTVSFQVQAICLQLSLRSLVSRFPLQSLQCVWLAYMGLKQSSQSLHQVVEPGLPSF